MYFYLLQNWQNSKRNCPLFGNSTLSGCPSTWNPVGKDIKTMPPQSGAGRTLTKRRRNRLPGVFAEDRAAFIASLDDYSLLVIDDLGVERSTEYAMEQMFTVIDSRYRSKKPLIVTTNLKLEEIKNLPDLAHARIYDRILERCAPVLFSGKNFREERARATKAAAKEIVRKDNKV